MARYTYNPADLSKAHEFEFSEIYGFETDADGESGEDMFGEELMFLANTEDYSRTDTIYTAYKLGYMVAKGII